MINLVITLIGILAAVHLICTATFLNPKAPVSVISEVSLGFACAIGVVVTSFVGDEGHLLLFCSGLILCLILFYLEKAIRHQSLYIRDPYEKLMKESK